MAKLSAEQQRQLDELEALRDQADDDDETVVWVRKGDHETRLTGKRAERWLRENGYDPDDADDSSKDAPLDPKAAGGKAGGKPAKKAAAPKPGDDAPGNDGPELDQDAPGPTRNRRAFF
jgi:hypothetical protein